MIVITTKVADYSREMGHSLDRYENTPGILSKCQLFPADNKQPWNSLEGILS